MTDLVDEDDRRFWVRTIICDTCNTEMRDYITWGTYKSMVSEQAADLVGTTLAEKWNRRDPWEPEMTDLSDEQKLKLLAEIVNERKLLKLESAAEEEHSKAATVLASEAGDLKVKLAKAERLLGENTRDAEMHGENVDHCLKRIDELLSKLEEE